MIEAKNEFIIDDSSKSECLICFEEYNSEDRSPIVIQCGHTICKYCVSQLKICSFCKAPIVKTVQNYALSHALEAIKDTKKLFDEKRKKICETHSIKNNGFYCENDKCLKYLCRTCVIDHIEQSHIISKINDNNVENLSKINDFYHEKLEKLLFSKLKSVNSDFIIDLENKKNTLIMKEKQKIANDHEEKIKILNEFRIDAEKALDKLNKDFEEFINNYKYIADSVNSLIKSFISPIFTIMDNVDFDAQGEIQVLKILSQLEEKEKVWKTIEIFENQDLDLCSNIVSHVEAPLNIILNDVEKLKLSIFESFQNSVEIRLRKIQYEDNFSSSDYNIKINSCFEKLVWYVRRLFEF